MMKWLNTMKAPAPISAQRDIFLNVRTHPSAVFQRTASPNFCLAIAISIRSGCQFVGAGVGAGVGDDVGAGVGVGVGAGDDVGAGIGGVGVGAGDGGVGNDISAGNGGGAVGNVSNDCKSRRGCLAPTGCSSSYQSSEASRMSLYTSKQHKGSCVDNTVVPMIGNTTEMLLWWSFVGGLWQSVPSALQAGFCAWVRTIPAETKVTVQRHPAITTSHLRYFSQHRSFLPSLHNVNASINK